MQDWILELQKVTEPVLLQEPMKKHITFRVGGPAEVFLSPKKEELKDILHICKTHEIPVTIIGNGSNLLVSDKGISGVVLEIGKNMQKVEAEGNVIFAEAGAMLSTVAQLAKKNSLTGMEFAAGIPGSIGGAVLMNAGAYDGEMKNIVKDVTILNENLEIEVLPAEKLDYAYRHSALQSRNVVILGATLVLQTGDQTAITEKMEDFQGRRSSKQPLNYPSAGSTFKRPEGYFAGKLIEDCGLKGYRVGGAMVSEKHSGFVINYDNATASDVYQVIQDVQKKVREQYQVELQTEVKLFGEF